MNGDAILALAAARAAAHGVDAPDATIVPELAPVTAGLPGWWDAGGNLMLAPPGRTLPAVNHDPGKPPATGAVVVLGGATAPGVLVLWGERPLILLGAGTHMPAAMFCCGGGSSILVGDRTGCTWNGRADARNGGLVAVGADGLWASGVQLNSDDMHAIRARDGRRLNPFGGSVVVDRHVWLAHEALLLSGARVGADTVVGARSVVTGALPAASVCVGSPARPVRHDVTWSFDDLP